MRHSLYINAREKPREKKKLLKGYKHRPANTETGPIKDQVLNVRVLALMDRYQNDANVIEDLKREISTFLLNLTVARDLKSKDQENKLKSEFNTYLSKLEKE